MKQMKVDNGGWGWGYKAGQKVRRSSLSSSLMMSHQTTLHCFFTAVNFTPLRLGCAPHTAPPCNGAHWQMTLTDFFQ
jgi:hypothetical protein